MFAKRTKCQPMVKKQTTKDLIAESLRELMEQMPFERITVRDIIQNCELSSTTFYKHFRDKYDLIEWIYHKDSRAFIDRISDTYTWKDAALDTLYSFYGKQRVLPFLFPQRQTCG